MVAALEIHADYLTMEVNSRTRCIVYIFGVEGFW